MKQSLSLDVARSRRRGTGGGLCRAEGCCIQRCESEEEKEVPSSPSLEEGAGANGESALVEREAESYQEASTSSVESTPTNNCYHSYRHPHYNTHSNTSGSGGSGRSPHTREAGPGAARDQSSIHKHRKRAHPSVVVVDDDSSTRDGRPRQTIPDTSVRRHNNRAGGKTRGRIETQLRFFIGSRVLLLLLLLASVHEQQLAALLQLFATFFESGTAAGT